jgi:hypothetical protein
MVRADLAIENQSLKSELFCGYGTRQEKACLKKYEPEPRKGTLGGL